MLTITYEHLNGLDFALQSVIRLPFCIELQCLSNQSIALDNLCSA